MGLKMPKVLAWFITFNFINIAWVFFRAKEWSDAIKVLSSMFNIDNIVIKEKFANKLGFLADYNMHFLEIMKMTYDSNKALSWILSAFFIVLVFRNSTEKLNRFKTTVLNMLFVATLLSVSLYYMEIIEFSEFLYFNF